MTAEQRSGKFTRGPVTRDKHGDLVDAAGNGIRFCRVAIALGNRIGEYPDDAEGNTSLAEAAFNAATTAEDMGYDGQAAVKKLPELLRGLWRIAYEPQGHPEASESEVLTRCEDIAGALLTALRAKQESTP